MTENQRQFFDFSVGKSIPTRLLIFGSVFFRDKNNFFVKILEKKQNYASIFFRGIFSKIIQISGFFVSLF